MRINLAARAGLRVASGMNRAVPGMAADSQTATVATSARLGMDTLAATVYATLREKIVTVEILPGSMLSENTLSEMLGVSRTPVREAVKQLERDYLVRILSRRGILVTDVDLHEQLLLLDVRRGLEGQLFTRAATRSNAEQRKRFQALAQQLKSLAAKNDIVSYHPVDREFDQLVDECAQNHFISDMLQPVHSLSRRFWHTHRNSEASRRVAELHSDVAIAIGAGEVSRVKKCFVKLIKFNEAYIRSLIG